MRILGIDPGIARLGWGIIDERNGKPVTVAYDCFETSSTLSTPDRLEKIYEFLMELIEEYKPEAMGIEELFFNTNAKTAFVVGQARGVVLLVAAQKQMQLGIYTPLQVKIGVTGYGKAEKKQVEKMVTMLLGLKNPPKLDDTFDALAVALTHHFSHKISKLSAR